jgi:RNA polymerase sigma factor (sigma-70 family)
MTSTRTDADLVAAYLAGDRNALADVYDRYADSLYDTAAAMLGDRHEAADVAQDVFVIAAERMGQLRDPGRLKPWMFAILRNEVYRRTKKRRRAVPTDFTGTGADVALPSDDAPSTDSADFDELAELVRGAARGLDARDQLVLEYTVRQDLKGDELAAALGVSTQQGYGLVHRMRERTERSLGAFCVARKGRKECPELAAILGSWDGEFSVLIRKRVARHIDGCEICERTRRKFAPIALFGAAPALAAPPGLRDRVLGRIELGGHVDVSYGFTKEGGFPSVVRAGRRLALLVSLGVIGALLLVGSAAFLLGGDDEPDVLAGVDATTAVTAAPPTAASLAATGEPATTVPSSTSTTVAGTTTTTTTVATTTSIADVESSVSPPLPGVPSPPTTKPKPTATTTVPATIPEPTVPPETTTPPTTAPPTTAPPTTPPPPPAQIALTSSVIDLGTSVTQGAVTLTNVGGTAMPWSLQGGVAPFQVSPIGGTLAPGDSEPINVTLDRTGLAEGSDPAVNVSVTSPGLTSTGLTLKAQVRRAPQVTIVSGPPSPQCWQQAFGSVSATIVEENLVTPVVLRWTGPSQSGSGDMAFARGAWRGGFAVDPTPSSIGRWTYQVVATDAFGLQGTAGGSFDVTAEAC